MHLRQNGILKIQMVGKMSANKEEHKVLKKFSLEFEGIDRSGKNIVSKYVNILGKYKYVLMDRGLMSNITYARINNRPYEYDVEQFRNWTIIYLVCDKEDWEVRCKIDNEPKIDYDLHLAEFNKTAKILDDAGVEILVYNTSKYTPYAIAKDIIKYMEQQE